MDFQIFKWISPELAYCLFKNGHKTPFIKVFRQEALMSHETINGAVVIAKEDGNLEALKNACGAYMQLVKMGV